MKSILPSLPDNLTSKFVFILHAAASYALDVKLLHLTACRKYISAYDFCSDLGQPFPISKENWKEIMSPSPCNNYAYITTLCSMRGVFINLLSIPEAHHPKLLTSSDSSRLSILEQQLFDQCCIVVVLSFTWLHALLPSLKLQSDWVQWPGSMGPTNQWRLCKHLGALCIITWWKRSMMTLDIFLKI